jgi:6-phosphofructokinase 2
MSSILTVTLNPAIDKSTTVPELLPEKKMQCSPPLFEPGGGGVNVARAIKKLGGNATAVYLAGGYTGKFFTALLSREEIASVIIEIEQHTRENLIVFDAATNLQYRFGMPGPQIKEQEWQEVLKVIDTINYKQFIVVSGSAPSGVPLDIFAKIAAIAKTKKAKCIIDTSGEALQYAAAEGVYLLKPNMGELASLVGVNKLSSHMVKAAARDLIDKGKCEVAVVSMGAEGAMVATKDFELQVKPPPVKIKSTVGAGDSMVAGIVYSLAAGKSIEQSIKYGVACGTAATLNPGTALCKPEDAERLYHLVQIANR